MCIKIQKDFLVEKGITTHVTKLELDDISSPDVCAPEYIREDDTHVELCTTNGFLSCGTAMHMNDTHVSYVNNVKTKNEANQDMSQIIATVIKEYVVPWHCIYPLEYIVNLSTGVDGGYYIPDFTPITKITVLSAQMEQMGQFPVLMQLYKTAEYTTPYQKAPELSVTDQLYVEVKLVAAPQDAKVQLLKCWATPTMNKEHSKNYGLIDDGCVSTQAAGEAATTIIKNSVGHSARYESNVFKFAQFPRVYLHCDIKVCFDDGTGNCQMDECSTETRRKRSLNMDGVEYADESVATVTLGPISLEQEVYSVNIYEENAPTLRFDIIEDEGKAKTLFGLPMIFIYCFIAILVIIIGLIFGIVILVLRRRSAAQQQEKALTIMDHNGHTFIISATGNSSHFTETDTTSVPSTRSMSHASNNSQKPVVLVSSSQLKAQII